jgi:hypothetical protein
MLMTSLIERSSYTASGARDDAVEEASTPCALDESRSNLSGDYEEKRQVDGEAAQQDHNAADPVAQRPNPECPGGQERRK